MSWFGPQLPRTCKKLARPSPTDRNLDGHQKHEDIVSNLQQQKHEDAMSDLQQRIERSIRDHGRMVIGVYPDKESSDPLNARFCYTIGNTQKGLPELL